MFRIRSPRALIREFRAASSGLAEPQAWLSEALGGTPTLAGERVSIEGAIAMADVFAAINLIGEAIGAVPLKVYKDLRLSLLPREGIEEAPDHRMWRILHDMPNGFTPAMRFWSTITVHQLGWGNWYIEKLRGPDGLVDELRIVHPATVEVFWSESRGDKTYRVTRQMGEQVWMDDDQLLHGFGVSTDGIIGLSPIQQSREALGIVKARERFEGDAYGSHPYASGVITHPQTVKDGKKIRDDWRAIYGSGSKDRGGVAVLDEGASFVELSMPMADMQFVEATQLSKTQIANIFKLPPSYIGGSIGDSLTYATVESNKIWLATQTLAPICANIASFLGRDFSLFPFQSWFPSFDLTELTAGDSKARSDYWQAMHDLGVVTPELIAEREGLPPPPPPKPVPPALAPFVPVEPPSAGNGNIAPVGADASA